MRNANVAGTAGLTLIMGIGKVQKCPSTPLRLATQDDDCAYGKLREARSIRGGNPSEIVSYHSLFLFVILSTTVTVTGLTYLDLDLVRLTGIITPKVK